LTQKIDAIDATDASIPVLCDGEVSDRDGGIIIDDEYSKLVPPLTEKEYEGLKLSISIDGQHFPIIVNEQGIILDGHHRFRACKELKIEPKIEEKSFSSKLKEIEFVVDSNLKRRHLNPFQKAELGYNFENAYRKAAKARQLSSLKLGTKLPWLSNDNNGESGRTGDKIALHVGLSPATYNRAKKIIEVGPESVKEKLRSGKGRLFQEYTRIQMEEKRRKQINEKPIINLPNGCQLHLGDFREKGKTILDNSIDLMFTDPPYGIEHLPLFEDIGEFAYRKLKEGGSLVLLIGQFLKDKKMNLITKSGLEYCWEICVMHTGHHASTRTFGNLIDVGWKPLTWFVKGKKTSISSQICDLIKSEPPDKTTHPWAQSPVEAEYVVGRLTVENQTVVDPFMGDGTFGIAALKLKRQFFGIEKDREYFSKAERRLSK
jgi:DNA modification methylase